MPWENEYHELLDGEGSPGFGDCWGLQFFGFKLGIATARLHSLWVLIWAMNATSIEIILLESSEKVVI